MTARRYALAVICCVVCGVGFSWAGAGTTKRHQHGAHIHGTAAVNIVIDDRTAIIELTAPADSVVGFEHQAKSAADQTRQAKALDLLRNNIDQHGGSRSDAWLSFRTNEDRCGAARRRARRGPRHFRSQLSDTIGGE